MTTNVEVAPVIPAHTARHRATASGTRQSPAGLTSAGLITVLIGAALPIIDFFIVNVALPTIDTTLHANTATLELVVASYGIAYALLMVLGGRLGDAFGRRKLFTVGLWAFTITSLACGLAPTALTLVLARVAQGASSALMLPQVLSTIQATTHGEKRSRALGIYGAVGGIGTVVGQLLGGALVSADIAGLSWRPIFLVNVPIGLVGLLLAKRNVPETRSANPIGIDRLGTAVLGIAMLTLLVPLMEGSALGWPVWMWISLGAFPFAAAAFVLVERRAERAGSVPLLPPSIMRIPSMRRGLLVAVPFFTGFGGFMFVYAVTLQDGLHLGPLGSGLALTPMAVGFFSTSLISSRLVTRFGSKVIPMGVAIQAIGIALTIGVTLLAWPNLNVLVLAPSMLITGLGQGMAMTTLFRVILAHVPPESAGVGSGALATTQQTSLALGVAILGTLFATLSAPTVLGMRDAFVLVMAVQVVLALVIVFAGQRLPDPRK
ncbi:MAG TPA: MFS transporter [Pseudonocardiaceae bacterium]|jgi:MFS family permease